MRSAAVALLPALILIVPGIGLVFVGAWRLLARGGARLCPGPRRRFGAALRRVALAPWRLFTAEPCGYDLFGLPEAGGANTGVTCPECGTRVGRGRGRTAGVRRPVRRAARLRPFRLGSTLVGAGLLIGAAPVVRSGAWVKYVPTTALVAIERLPQDETMQRFRRELDARVAAGSLTSGDEAAVARVIAEQLRCDATAGNAARAQRVLTSLWPASEPALQRALDSDDGQQRRLAALLLTSLPGAKVTDAVIEACVESLAHDDIAWNATDASWVLLELGEPAIPALQRALDCGDEQLRRHAAYILRSLDAPPTAALLRESVIDLETGSRTDHVPSHAKSAAVWLVERAERAEPLLVEALRSPDPQQRFLAAFVAGYGGRDALVEEAAPILIMALADNEVAGDARMAAPALYRFGPPVIPHLRPLLESADAQERAAADLIISALTDPHPGRVERERRARLSRVLSGTSDLESSAAAAIEGWW